MTFSLSLKKTKSLVKNTHLLITGTSVTLRFQSISVGHLGTEFTTVILLSDEVFPAKSNTFFGPCSKLYDMKPTDQNGKNYHKCIYMWFPPLAFHTDRRIFWKMDAPHSHICVQWSLLSRVIWCHPHFLKIDLIFSNKYSFTCFPFRQKQLSKNFN